MPNFNDKSVWQSSSVSVGVVELGSLPNIYGKIDADNNTAFNFFGEWTTSPSNYFSGAFSCIEQARTGFSDYTENTGSIRQITFDASQSNAAYGRSGNIVIPTSNNIKFCIRY